MKSIVTLLVAATAALSVSPALAQPESHPFEEIVGQRLTSSNIFLLWQETTGGVTEAKHKVYSYDGEVPVDERITGIPGVADGPTVDGNQKMVVTSGNFNVDPYDDVVAAWEGEAQRIELFIPHFDTTDRMWNASSVLTVDQPAAGSGADGRILLETGDLDGDGLDEIVLVYQDNQDRIQLQVYDTDGTLTPVLKASNSDEVVPVIPGLDEATPFAVTLADVNDDGREEIVQLGIDPDLGSDGRWAMYWKVYELVDGNTLNVVVNDPGYTEPSFDFTIAHFAVESGRYRPGRPDEFCFVWSFDRREPAPNTADDTFVYLLFYDEESGAFMDNIVNSPDARLEYNAVTNAAEMEPLATVAGDFNGDGIEEVVVAVENSKYVFSSDDFLNLTQRSRIGMSQYVGISYDYLSAGDLDYDGISEVIAARVRDVPGGETEEFEVWALSVYDGASGAWKSTGEATGILRDDEQIPGGVQTRRFAIATGSFDGYAFTLGEPEHSVSSEVSQPLVILNAPPVHFDVFEGEAFDINDCYAGSECGFSATYQTSHTTTTTVTTEVMKDWGVSLGVGFSGTISAEPLGVGVSTNVEAYFDAKYGKNFSNESAESETVSFSQEIVATVDDVIYATVTDYDIWEYPAYHGTEDFPRRYVMVAAPIALETITREGQWFPSKSWTGNAYIPDHEVGNILSYPAYANLTENPNVEQLLHASETYVIGADPDYDWYLKYEDFNTTTEDTTREVGFDAKVHNGVYRLSGDYTRSDMSTHSTTVSEGLSLLVTLGDLDQAIGETAYSVTPYAYWATNGALVIDYAVQPDRAAAGGVSTWWDEHYSDHPDPALILPWRYDPEKGYALGDEIKRYRTKDIIFDNPSPLPGDTLTITARVRNFSFVGTSEPVAVSFYVGDPDDGGMLITGTEGETSVTTGVAIPARRWADAAMRWVVPNDLPSTPRIWVALDEADAIPEIHTTNNKGFNILLMGGGVSIEEPPDAVLPGTVRLHAAYPNPFSDRTVIPYEIGDAGRVQIEVYDVLGRRVVTLDQGMMPAGRHQVTWEAGDRASGMYFLVLQSDEGRHTRQVVLMK